jgi:hypothetical protein
MADECFCKCKIVENLEDLGITLEELKKSRFLGKVFNECKCVCDKMNDENYIFQTEDNTLVLLGDCCKYTYGSLKEPIIHNKTKLALLGLFLYLGFCIHLSDIKI